MAQAAQETPPSPQPPPLRGEGERIASLICRRNFRGFYFAGMFLPQRKRDAVFAAGAFFRMIAGAIPVSNQDSNAPTTVNQQSCGSGGSADSTISFLRDRLDELYTARMELPLPEFRSEDQHILGLMMNVVRRYEIPAGHFLDFAKGLAAMATIRRYATWSSVETHCDAVGGSVARALACILGLTHSEAGKQISTLGKAVRLTYILRDISADWKRGRLLLPLEDMARFRYSERELSGEVVNTSFRELLRFEIERARDLFKDGSGGIRWLSNDGARVAVSMMTAWHLGILDAIQRRDYDVYSKQVELPLVQRLMVFPRAWKLARSATGE